MQRNTKDIPLLALDNAGSRRFSCVMVRITSNLVEFRPAVTSGPVVAWMGNEWLAVITCYRFVVHGLSAERCALEEGGYFWRLTFNQNPTDFVTIMMIDPSEVRANRSDVAVEPLITYPWWMAQGMG